MPTKDRGKSEVANELLHRFLLSWTVFVQGLPGWRVVPVCRLSGEILLTNLQFAKWYMFDFLLHANSALAGVGGGVPPGPPAIGNETLAVP